LKHARRLQQTPPLADFNPFLPTQLAGSVQREGAAFAREALIERGREIGSAR
jgi:hypothetical protein